MDIQKLQRLVIDALEDVKAQDIKVFNTVGLSDMFDRVVVASGTSNRQTKALAWSVASKVKEAGGHVVSVEGTDPGEWVLVDLGDLVVHIMQPAIRQYYGLEEIWGAKPVKVKLSTEARPRMAQPSEPMEEPAPAPARKAPRKAVTKAAAKKTAAKKPAKKAPGKSAARKAPARKAAARKATPGKSAAAPVRKKAVKKTVKTAATGRAGATTARKAGASKAAVKKSAAKKAPVRRSSARTPVAKSTRKTAAKRAAR